MEEGYLREFATKAGKEFAKNLVNRATREGYQFPPTSRDDTAPLGGYKETLTVDNDGMPMINVIAGGAPCIDESIYLTSAAEDKRKRENVTAKGNEIRAFDRMVILFPEEDEKRIVFPYNDTFVVTPVIGNHGIRRTLIDNSNAINLFSLETYELMKRPTIELMSCEKPIIGVNIIPIPVKGTTFLAVYFREDESKRREELLFVITIDLPPQGNFRH